MLGQENKLKFMSQDPDGCFALVFHLESGNDGAFELNDGNNIVFQKQIKQSWMCNTRKVHKRLGLMANNVDVVGLQAEMDAQCKQEIIEMVQNPDTHKDQDKCL